MPRMLSITLLLLRFVAPLVGICADELFKPRNNLSCDRLAETIIEQFHLILRVREKCCLDEDIG